MENPMAQHDLTDLVTRIEAVGGTVDQLLALSNVARVCGDVIAWNRAAEFQAHSLVERLEQAARGPAITQRQADYITALGGTVTDAMTKAEASTLIDQLKTGGAYRTVASATYGPGRVHADMPGATQYDDGSGRYAIQIWDN